MTALFLVSTILLLSLLISVVISLSTNKKVLPKKIEKTLIETPSLKSKYSDYNVASTRILCVKDIYPVFPQPTIRGNLHVSDTLSEKNARLTLSNKGVLEYFLNESLLWSSIDPRAHYETVDSKAMLFAPSWTPSIKSGELSLSLLPLSIKRNTMVHWTYVSGFEPRCTSKPDCPVVEISKLAVGGEVFLFSKNRKYRAALLHNSDLVVLNIESEKPGSHVLKETLQSSLITQLCTL